MISILKGFILALLLSSTLSAQTIVTSGDKLYWDQTAPSLAVAQGFQYLAYIDNVLREALLNVTCAGALSPFACSAKFPSFPISGVHNLQLTASDIAESAKSSPFQVQINAPTAPINVRSATAAPSAVSCSEKDVQLAVDNAERGSVVTVPAGNCNWTAAVTLLKGVLLSGAGVGNTNISSPSVMLRIIPDAQTIVDEAAIKVSGFTFDGKNAAINFITVTGTGATSTKPFTKLLIGDNEFKNSVLTIANGGVIRTNGQVRGVIYRNSFDRCNFILGVFGNDTTIEWSNNHFPVTRGSFDNLYFEDNTIAFSSSFAGSDPGWFEIGQGGRVVVRFNTTDLTNTSAHGALFDSHGFQNWNGSPNSGQTGTMLVEYYRNVLTNPGVTNLWVGHRGTVGLYFDNTLTTSNTPNHFIHQYPGGCGDGDINPDPGGAYVPYVNNTYAFHNLHNGVEKVFTLFVDACNIAENVHFWNYRDAFNGTVGVGRGPVAKRPPTCTAGVGFWATDEGEWNTLNPGLSGRLYKCTATDTWTLWYTPFTYPHPLRTL